MDNLKGAILERLINCGKKNKRLKAPVMMLITLFLILFHGIRNFFVQFKMHPYKRRVLVGALCACLVVSSMPATDYAFPVLAAENSEDVQENGQEEIQENTHDGVYEIVSFTELPDEVKEQTVAVGTPLEGLALPDTLTAVCRRANEKNPEDNQDPDKEQDSGEEDEQPDEGKDENPEEDSDEGVGDESGDSDNEEEGREDESGDSDNEGEGSGDESGDSNNEGEGQEDESGDSSNEDEENGEASESNTGADDTDVVGGTDEGDTGNKEVVETQETFTVTLPEYYVEPNELPEIKELFYEETVTIGGITWESQPEYDGESEGVYLFTPVISDGTYTVAEDVELPEISVTVVEIMLAEEEGSTTPACGVVSSDTTWEAGELSDGTLTVEEDVTLTITGVITVSGDVTINGGGTIKRGDASAYFNISSGSNVMMGNIVVDGDLVKSRNSMIMISKDGTLTLDDGCVIENCQIIGAVEGGAINNRGTAIMNYSTIRNCYSAVYGGAIGNYGAMVINGSTIKDCQASYGGAIFAGIGSVNIEYATIEGCYASDSGGAIVLMGGRANVIIEDGMFINNRTGQGSFGWRGGCIGNVEGKLYIYGGNFIGNKSDIVDGSGSCISHMMFPDTVTEITGGNFEGNGRNAIYVESAVLGLGNEFILSGDIHFSNGGDEDADVDGIEVRFEKYVYENGNVSEGKIWINGTIISTVPVYLPYDIPASEGLVIAEGKDGYKLSKNDAKKISVTNTRAPEELWYAVLDEERNVLYLSQENPSYGYFVTYYSNDAEGTVTDNKEYTDMDNTVIVKDAVDLRYDGYVFDGWNTKVDGTGASYKPGDTFNITSDIDLYAQWKSGGAEYRVEHYLQDVSGDGYTKEETEILGGNVGEEVSAKPNTYRGFTENTTHASRIESGKVAADGSLALRLYYDREVYHITFDLNGGTGTTPEAQELRYGASLQEPGKPERRGYSFRGWYKDAQGTEGNTWDFDKTVEENTEKKSETLYAKWVDDIEPQLMQAEFNEGYKSVRDWIIRKKDLIITVPIIEEGSGVKQADYVLASLEKSDSENGPGQAQIIEEDGRTVAKITISSDFKGTVSMSCTDNAGNISAGKTLTSSGGGAAFIVEDNAPEITFSSKDGSLSDSFYDNVTVTVSVNDEGLQGNVDAAESANITGGIASVTYRLDSGAETAVEGKGFENGIVPSCDFSVEISGVGEHVLKVTATDNAGNANTGQARIKIAQKPAAQDNKTPVKPISRKESPELNLPTPVSEQSIALADAPQPLKTVYPVGDNEPRTGDTSHVEVYATIAMVSGLLYILLYFTTDKNGMTREEKEQFLSCLISWAKRGGKPRRLFATAVIFLFLVYYHSIGKCVAYDEKEIRV